MGSMRTGGRTVCPPTAFAQSLTEELIARAGVGPGMRVLVPEAGTGDVAFLVAERVGDGGSVLATDEDGAAIAAARSKAREQRFHQVEFREQAFDELSFDQPFDAVVSRFFLMHRADPVATLRRVSSALHGGGRLVVHEWHYESMLWDDTSEWPDLPLYRRFARWSVETMRRGGAHVDMGLRLVNAFAEAGLPLPTLRTDLHAVHGSGASGYAFFEETMRELLPSMERLGVANASDVAVDTFAQRLEEETVTMRGHAFLPLQVGAFARIESGRAA